MSTRKPWPQFKVRIVREQGVWKVIDAPHATTREFLDAREWCRDRNRDLLALMR